MSFYKKLSLTMVAALTLVASFAMAESKIAIMNYEQVLFNSVAAQEATQALRVQLEPEQKQLNDINAQMQNRENRYQTDKDIMTEEELATLQSEVQELRSVQSQIVARMQQVQAQNREQFIQSFQPIVREMVAQFVKENGYTLILDSQVVLWNEGEPDITEAIMTTFDAWYAEQKTAQQ